MASPRVLTLTFSFHVPEGLNANIRSARIESAADSICSAVQALAGTVFPWADRMSVSRDWSYQWWGTSETINLPKTETNTVTETAASGAAEEA